MLIITAVINNYSTYSALSLSMVVLNTVRGKILEGENFGESIPLKLLAGKILANLPVVNRKFYT